MKFKLILIVSLLPLIAWAGNISLTVYNQGQALVHENRDIEVSKGISTYQFTNIPANIDPTSVHFSCAGVDILEQNYQYDIASPQKILDKMAGEKIRVFFEGETPLEGILQPSQGGTLMVLDDKGGVQIIHSEQLTHYDFPKMPEGFVDKPTLVWLLNAQSAGNKQAEISYLTGGLDWHSEYVAVARKETIGFSGWVSIENNCGMTFNDAKVKLMAGDLHLAQPEAQNRYVTSTAMEMSVDAGKQFAEKSFYEYHLYTLQRESTLKNHEIKQISLFPESEVKYQKEYIYDFRKDADNIGVFLVFKNSASAGLGIPLPEGKIRVYQADDDGTLEFIGEDKIDHTPKDEKITLETGKAFDLAAERTVLDTRQIPKKEMEQDIQVSLRNHKTEAVTVVVRDYSYGNWKILNASHPYERINASTVEFTVQLQPHKEDEETLLKYTVKVTWKK